jgi:pimeloyl-ACP methyl ester carboxylesterase
MGEAGIPEGFAEHARSNKRVDALTPDRRTRHIAAPASWPLPAGSRAIRRCTGGTAATLPGAMRRLSLLALLAVVLPLPAAAQAAPAPPAPVASAAATPSIASAPVRTVKAGQGRIGYRSVGKGPAVVFVMGLSGTMDAWAPSFVDAVAASGHRVITFDNEGIGRTTLGKGTLTIKRMADDTASLIRALKLKRADVVGWSMGGMIAQATAIRYPKRVRRVVLAATAPGDGKGRAPAPSVFAGLAGEDSSGLVGALFPADRQDALNAWVADVARYQPFRASAPAKVSQAQLGACAGWLIGRDPASASPAKIKQRVLVGAGIDDPILPYPNQQHLAAAAPRATLKAYPHAAHGFLFQEPEFLDAVVTFLQ